MPGLKLMSGRFFQTKSIEEFREVDGAEHQLDRTLSATALVLLAMGAIIGTGIFVLTGTTAANHAGPALVLSFIVAAVGCAFAGLCYAEFAAMIPVSGSAYSYAYATLGEGIAWFIGWNLILEYLFSAATVSAGWAGYVLNLLNDFGLRIPAALSQAPFAQGAGAGFSLVRTGALIDAPAVAIVLVMAGVCYVGIRRSSRFNTVIVAIKVTVVMMFILMGLGHIQLQNWHPFIPPNQGNFGRFGWSGIMAGSGVIFYAYLGFDAVSTAAQETRNPQRDLPIGILMSLLICTVLYVGVAAVLTGMVSYRKLDVAAPLALAIDSYPSLHWLGLPVKLGAVAGMTTVLLVAILAQARIFLAMGRDGLLPAGFARVHRRFRTPSTATVVTGVCAAVMGGLFPVGVLGRLVSIGTLIAFITVCVGVLVLRHSRPDLPRPFRVPAPWFTCIGGVVICAAIMLSLPWSTWVRLIAWTVLGTVTYALYGYRHSRVAQRPAAAWCRSGSPPQTRSLEETR